MMVTINIGWTEPQSGEGLLFLCETILLSLCCAVSLPKEFESLALNVSLNPNNNMVVIRV